MRALTSTSVRRTCSALALVVATATAAMAQRTHTTIVVGVGDAETGQFLRGVQVRLRSFAIEATTDSMGQAHLYGVRPGTYTVEARRVGYGLLTAPIMVGGTDSLEVVMLMRTAVTLDTVKVRASTTMREFEQRRARGVGQFVTQAQIDSAPGASLDAILRQHIRGVQVTGDPGNGVHIMSMRALLDRALNAPPHPCWPMIFVDGLMLPQDTKVGPDISFLSPATIAGIEYYGPSEIPGQYKAIASFSPAQGSEQFNPDLLSPPSRAGSSRAGGAAGTPGTATPPPTNPALSNPETGRTAPGTMAGPLEHSITSGTCGAMLIWTRR